MKERILRIMEREEMSSSKFAEAIGIQRSAMSHITAGRNNPSLDVVLKILERFKYINPDWLLSGKGDMIRSQETITTSPDLFSNAPENQSIVQVIPENREDSGDKSMENTSKQAVIEHFIPIQKPDKSISKIMIFYSDNTFDTFVSENGKKD